MITWMQRHKKWLVITIWISTIAFVGAGFVGWGSYQFNKTGGDMAKVGNTTITVADVQNQYRNLYGQYKDMFGENFNNEMAEKLNLEKAAFDSAVKNATLINFAKEIGLDVTEEEVAKELVQIKSFHNKEGKFDKNIYITILGQNRTTPVEFESSIKQDLLMNKIKAIIVKFAEPTQNELEDIQKVLFAQDKLKIQVIDGSKLQVKIDQDAMKKFWEANKNNYLSSTSYEIETYTVDIKEDKKQSKKDALKTYLKLKKDEIKFQDKTQIFEDKPIFTAENMVKIQEAELGKVLKPLEENGKYIIAKVLRKINPEALPYDQAKSSVKVDFENQEKAILLEKHSQDALTSFKGKDIGFVSRESIDKISGLTNEEGIQFLNQLFLATTKQGIISVGSKSVVYEVVDSKLANYDSNKDQVIASTLNSIKTQAALDNLLKQLSKKYEMIRY